MKLVNVIVELAILAEKYSTHFQPAQLPRACGKRRSVVTGFLMDLEDLTGLSLLLA